MQFYDREKELELIHQAKKQSLDHAQMMVVVGRRRTGKTTLLKKAIEKEDDAIYYFIARKNEVLICEEFTQEIERILHVRIFGTVIRFRDLFQYLMELSETRSFTLVLDEFQQFYSINPSIYSELQNIWDSFKEKSKINLILCGSVYSLMRKIFENSKEPLFARATGRIHVTPFRVNTLKEILSDYFPEYGKEDLLAFYAITGGIAKYVELLVNRKAFTLEKIMDEIFSENSLFLEEGRNVLIEEFGKDYATYFSILSLLASSKTSRSDIESTLGFSIGGFLERLEKDFNLIRKVRPIFSRADGRNVKYTIVDNFLNFWFRFIFKYQSAVEIGNFDYVRSIVMRDYPTYSGKILERYFSEEFAIKQSFSAIGSWWEKGNNNEIDIVAVNDQDKKVLFAEVKRNKKNISIRLLREKSANVMNHLPGYTADFVALSLDDM